MGNSEIDLNKVDERMRGYYVAALTDRYIVGTWPVSNEFNIKENQSKILEVRIFNERIEHKWFRGNIGEEFIYRKLQDDDESSANYESPIEEYQILDIDLSRANYELPGNVCTTKGGDFYLPIEIRKEDLDSKKVCPCVKVKYYVPKYDEDKKDETTVHAYVKDWRLAGFEGVE